MFDKNSGLVKIWIQLLTSGEYEMDNVPDISNLRDIIAEMLKSDKEDR